MENGLPLVYEKNIGVKCFSMQFFINCLIKENKLKAFSSPEGKFKFEEKELQLVNRIDERLPYILHDKKSRKNYTIFMENHGGIIHNDGDSQTLYYSCIIEKLKEGLPSEMETDYYGLKFHVPRDNLRAKLEMNYSDDWESVGQKEKITDSLASTKIFGEKDKFFELILKYMQER